MPFSMSVSQPRAPFQNSLTTICLFPWCKNPDAIKKLRKATSDSIHIVFDAISLHEACAFTAGILEEGTKGRVIVLPITNEIQTPRNDVDITCTLRRHSCPLFQSNSSRTRLALARVWCSTEDTVHGDEERVTVSTSSITNSPDSSDQEG